MNNINRDSFVFYRSFYEILLKLNAEQTREYVLAMANYALNGELPKIEDLTADVAWTAAKPQIDANQRKYENSRKGGAPKGSHNNPYGRKGKSADEIVSSPDSTMSPSTSPTLEEVRAFFTQINMPTEADNFYHFNAGRGWMMGNAPIVSWQSVAKSWVSKVLQRNPNAGDPKLGVGEFRTADGRRTYGPGEIIVPETAAPRPGESAWWNETTQQWDDAA